MADYRELLRKAIDALPDNTGANRRAVYEKARSALVAQLRAIDPPLPAREITTHRLNLEDCIREVEHEATERLLGRFRAVEETESEDFSEVEDVTGEPVAAFDDRDDAVAVDEAEPEPEPEIEPADIESDGFVSPPADDFVAEPEMTEVETVEPGVDEPEVAAAEPEWREGDAEKGPADEDQFSAEPAPMFSPDEDGSSSVENETVETVDQPEPEPETESFRPGSIEDIIASAERAAGEPEDTEPSTTEPEDDERIVPFVPVAEPEDHAASEAEEKHFIVSEADSQPRSGAPLVDLHGRPLSGTQEAVAQPEPAMSSVREVELEPGILARPEVSDAQVAIDRAIAALDREARGEATGADEAEGGAAAEAHNETGDDDNPERRGIGPGGKGLSTSMPSLPRTMRPRRPKSPMRTCRKSRLRPKRRPLSTPRRMCRARKAKWTVHPCRARSFPSPRPKLPRQHRRNPRSLSRTDCRRKLKLRRVRTVMVRTSPVPQ